MLNGPLVVSGSPTYPTSRELYNERFDAIDPPAIAYCASPSDVQRCIAFARRHGVQSTARSGGHSYGGYSLVPGPGHRRDQDGRRRPGPGGPRRRSAPGPG